MPTEPEVDVHVDDAPPALFLEIEAASEVDAGSSLKIVAVLGEGDLRGRVIRFKDHAGADLGEAEVSRFDGEVSRTAEFSARAPIELGDYSWSATLAPADDQPDELTAAIPVSVQPHKTTVLVWDVPPTTEVGEKLSFKIGVKCTSNCAPGRWTYVLEDETDNEIARGTLSSEPWTGTEALYFAEVEVASALEPSLRQWKIKVLDDDHDHDHHIEHTAAAISFGVRTVPASEVTLTVEAIDAASNMPIKGARVVAHPYRALADEHGIARLRVPKGEYRLLVSGHKHIPFRASNEITGDVSIRVALDEDKGLSISDIWA